MPKICDNKSVGVIIEDNHGVSALIERENYPEAFAPIAGHVDGTAEDEAAKNEAKEEGGLTLGEFTKVFEEDISNPCKREGGSHHFWTVYESHSWTGELKASSDAKKAHWMTPEQVRRIAARTEYFMRKYGVGYEDVDRLTRAIFGDPEKKLTNPEWKREMGLEPVWYYIYKKLGKI